jgi:hypothetical protein
VPKLRLLFAELPRNVRVLFNMIPLLFVSVMAVPLVLLILLVAPEVIFNAPELIAEDEFIFNVAFPVSCVEPIYELLPESVKLAGPLEAVRPSVRLVLVAEMLPDKTSSPPAA